MRDKLFTEKQMYIVQFNNFGQMFNRKGEEKYAVGIKKISDY